MAYALHWKTLATHKLNQILAGITIVNSVAKHNDEPVYRFSVSQTTEQPFD